MPWRLSEWLRGLLQRRAPEIPDALWQATLQRHAFLHRRSRTDQEALKRLSESFLQQKSMTGMEGLILTDAMVVDIAAQACLPILHRGLALYRGFRHVVVYPGPVRVRREVVDEVGIVHETEDVLVGEVLDGGPVVLSWQDGVAAAISAHSPPDSGSLLPESLAREPAFNVVIHEFVHVLDGSNGAMDGIPPMPAAEALRWEATLREAFDRFDERRVCGYPGVVDPYGAQDLVEFFAVAAEAYFVAPEEFEEEFPALSQCFRAWFERSD
jgi:Mlc titration factor MtfA (ptsG expression regulator)